jgi:hypothetical protein
MRFIFLLAVVDKFESGEKSGTKVETIIKPFEFF